MSRCSSALLRSQLGSLLLYCKINSPFRGRFTPKPVALAYFFQNKILGRRASWSRLDWNTQARFFRFSVSWAWVKSRQSSTSTNGRDDLASRLNSFVSWRLLHALHPFFCCNCLFLPVLHGRGPPCPGVPLASLF